MPFLQDIIYKFEVGGGLGYLRKGLMVLAVLLVIIGYNVRAYKNISTQEGMDAAQLARNLANGKGFTTSFVRPFSMFLVQKARPASEARLPDAARLNSGHPDLFNPPVYPLFLAGLMKVLPFRYEPPMSNDRVQSDFVISVFNQLFFFATIGLVFLLARKLFDSAVAWLSAFLLFVSELLWRFSVSGLPTMLLLLFFVCLVWLLVLLEQEVREPKRGDRFLLFLALLCGLLVGIGALTRYAFGFLILPVLAFILMFVARRRFACTAVAAIAFLLVFSPWLVRNYKVCKEPLGIAGYAFLEDTFLFPGNTLERSLQPDLGARGRIPAMWEKTMTNGRQLLRQDIPNLGGSWISAFFLAGLLVPFNRPAARRMRFFLLMCLGVLAIAQIVLRTQLSVDSPEVNSENLLVLLTPLVILYGISFFFILLDQVQFQAFQLRYVVIGLFAILLALPMALALRPRPSPLAFPPYHPAGIAYITSPLPADALVMSDVPWAVAWYGQRQSVWHTWLALTEETQGEPREDFSVINNYHKAIRALYLTPVTTQSAFLNQDKGWGKFIMLFFLARQVPPAFPLSFAPPRTSGWEQIVLGDSDYWR